MLWTKASADAFTSSIPSSLSHHFLLLVSLFNHNVLYRKRPIPYPSWNAGSLLIDPMDRVGKGASLEHDEDILRECTEGARLKPIAFIAVQEMEEMASEPLWRERPSRPIVHPGRPPKPCPPSQHTLKLHRRRSTTTSHTSRSRPASQILTPMSSTLSIVSPTSKVASNLQGFSLRRALEFSKRAAAEDISIDDIPKRSRCSPILMTPSPSIRSMDSAEVPESSSNSAPSSEPRHDQQDIQKDLQDVETLVKGRQVKEDSLQQLECPVVEDGDQEALIDDIEEERDDYQLAALEADEAASKAENNLKGYVKREADLRNTISGLNQRLVAEKARSHKFRQARDLAQSQLAEQQAGTQIFQKASVQEEIESKEQLRAENVGKENIARVLSPSRSDVEGMMRRLEEAESQTTVLREQNAQLQKQVQVEPTRHEPVTTGTGRVNGGSVSQACEVDYLRWALSENERISQINHASSSNTIFSLQTKVEHLEAEWTNAKRSLGMAQHWGQRIEAERDEILVMNRRLSKEHQESQGELASLRTTHTLLAKRKGRDTRL